MFAKGCWKRNKLETCYACIWDTAVNSGREGGLTEGVPVGPRAPRKLDPQAACVRVCVDTAAHPDVRAGRRELELITRIVSVRKIALIKSQL